MNYSYNTNCVGFKPNKKIELLEKIMEYTGIRYMGKWGTWVVPLDFGTYPYIETDYGEEGVTLRKLTDLSREDYNSLNEFTDTIYKWVMGLEKSDWDNLHKVSVEREGDKLVLINYN